MVNDDAPKSRKSDDHCKKAEKQRRVQAFATVVQYLQRWCLERDFRLVLIIMPMQNRSRRRGIEYATVLTIHRREFPFIGIYA